MPAVSGFGSLLWGKTRLGIWGICLVAASACLLPANVRAAAVEGIAGAAILVPVQEATPAETPMSETPAPTAETPAETEAPPAPEATAAEGEAPVAEATEGEATAAAEEAPPTVGSVPAGSELAYTINTLFMMICAVLVIFMQAGFAMVEVGLNSSKNAVNILFKNLMDFCLGVLLFWLVGFGLMYPGADYAGKWYGFAGMFVTRDLGAAGEGGVYPNYASSADFMFQVAFAATAATIVSGAVAGRLKFTSYLIYSAVITAFVYPISGMWKWGGGALHVEGFADFAGSIVVHAVGGFAGLAGAIALGPRIGRYTSDGKSVPIPGHNLTFAALGVFILWVGWYGFNPGSQLTYGGSANAEVTLYIGLTTTLAAAAGTFVAMVASWILFRKPDLSMALNGALAGLVGITANCNQVEQWEAVVIGAVAGLLVVGAIIVLDKLRIDDPVGAFPVHGVCGFWGGVATGIFGDAIPEGLDRTGYILLQLKGSVIISVWAFVTMFALFMILKVIGQLRVSPEEELKGLDVCEHGQHAYNP